MNIVMRGVRNAVVVLVFLAAISGHDVPPTSPNGADRLCWRTPIGSPAFCALPPR